MDQPPYLQQNSSTSKRENVLMTDDYIDFPIHALLESKKQKKENTNGIEQARMESTIDACQTHFTVPNHLSSPPNILLSATSSIHPM